MADLSLFEYVSMILKTAGRFQPGCAGDPRRRFYITLVALLGLGPRFRFLASPQARTRLTPPMIPDFDPLLRPRCCNPGGGCNPGGEK